jgi:hypothetical protein
MCPSCGVGQWLNYSPTEWKVTTPKHTTIFSQETINWEDRKDKLVARKTEQLALYAPNGDCLSKERINAELKRKGYDSKEEDKENKNPTTLTDGKKRSIVGSSNLIQTTKDIVKKHQTEVMKMKKRIQNKSIGKAEKQ